MFRGRTSKRLTPFHSHSRPGPATRMPVPSRYLNLSDAAAVIARSVLTSPNDGRRGGGGPVLLLCKQHVRTNAAASPSVQCSGQTVKRLTPLHRIRTWPRDAPSSRRVCGYPRILCLFSIAKRMRRSLRSRYSLHRGRVIGVSLAVLQSTSPIPSPNDQRTRHSRRIPAHGYTRVPACFPSVL